MELVKEMLARLGSDYDEIDLTLALAEMFRIGWYRCDQRRVDKLLAGLPPEPSWAQVASRLRIPIRQDRTISSPLAVAKILRAVDQGTFPSFRRLAIDSGIDESTLRKTIKKESAELNTWKALARAMKTDIKVFLYS
jgi:hypothetical protein